MIEQVTGEMEIQNVTCKIFVKASSTLLLLLHKRESNKSKAWEKSMIS